MMFNHRGFLQSMFNQPVQWQGLSSTVLNFFRYRAEVNPRIIILALHRLDNLQTLGSRRPLNGKPCARQSRISPRSGLKHTFKCPQGRARSLHTSRYIGTIPYLRKSHSSAAASISACHAFFPCPSIVAAINSYRCFPPIRSAAFRNIAALSANVIDSHAGLAARADSMALETSTELALVYLATTCL